MNIGLETSKVVLVTPPAAIVDNAAFTTASVDTRGYRKCTFLVSLGALDIALAAFKLRESDDDGSADAYADVDGADFSVDSTLPAATQDNKMYAIRVDLRGRERYLDLTLTGGDGTLGTFATVHAILEDPEIIPTTAAGRGLADELAV
jgi:hypothetical protein